MPASTRALLNYDPSFATSKLLTIVVSVPGLDGSSYPSSNFVPAPRYFYHNPLPVFFADPHLKFSVAIALFNGSMSVRKGKSDKGMFHINDVRSTDLPFNPSLSFNVSVTGIRAHRRPQLARPLMSLIPSLLLIPLFRGVYVHPNATNKLLYRMATSSVLHR